MGFSPFFMQKLVHGDPAGGGARPPAKGPPGLLSSKGRDEMDAVNRLIQAGIRPDCAAETVLRYEARGDAAGLERYVTDAEQLASERKGERACLAV